MHEKMIDSGRRFGSLDLSMHSEKPPIPVAGGTAKMGRNGWTYWYALTRIGLRGTLTTPDRTVTVHGTGWLDRQWGDWNWMGFGEWKWFAVQLEGGREVVGYHILEPVSGRPISRLCQVVEPDGSYGIWNDLQVEDLGRWTSPESRDVYTVGWQISSSQAGLELEVDPAMVEQEVHRGLWEGSCAVEGTLGGERVSGVSLVELNTGRLGPTPIKLLSYLKAIGMGAKDRIAGRSIP
jgi:predicted secreted hydrolase